MFMKRNYIALLDVDAFFAQAEQVIDPSIRGKPVVILQSTERGDGASIAVSYEAKALGIKRGMNKKELDDKYPNLVYRRMPLSEHSKSSDRTKYELESAKIFDLICGDVRNIVVEKASIDEMYMDLTAYVKSVMANEVLLTQFKDSMSEDVFPEHSCYLSSIEDQKEAELEAREILAGRVKNAISENDLETIAFFVSFMEVCRIRSLIKEKTGYETSVGVSYSKKIAKYICKRHRPFSNTLMLPEAFRDVYGQASITEITGMGGSFGKTMTTCFGAKILNDLIDMKQEKLREGLTSEEYVKISDLCQGGVNEKVKFKNSTSAVSASKTMAKGVNNFFQISEHLNGIIKDLIIKLDFEKERRNRVPVSFGISYAHITDQYAIKSKAIKVNSNNYAKILPDICLNALKEAVPVNVLKIAPLSMIGVSANKFEEMQSSGTIKQFFEASKNNKDRKRTLARTTSYDGEVVVIDDNDEENVAVDDAKMSASNSKKRKTEGVKIVDLTSGLSGSNVPETKKEDNDSDIEIIKIIENNGQKNLKNKTNNASKTSKAGGKNGKKSGKKNQTSGKSTKSKQPTTDDKESKRKTVVVQEGRRSINFFCKK
uniref:UmuC domain-containing protein n=1 Tax=Rhabditophanes sp. KR3021 TaxID=114890 RepID=A0AC35TLN7_9BILA